MNLQFAYSELVNSQNIKYSYRMDDGFVAYNQNSLEIYIFRAMDYRHIAVVKRLYGQYRIKEL